MAEGPRCETLFIDARKPECIVDRILRDLSMEHLARIEVSYHAWLDGRHVDVFQGDSGYCESAALDKQDKALQSVLKQAKVVGMMGRRPNGLELCDEGRGL